MSDDGREFIVRFLVAAALSILVAHAGDAAAASYFSRASSTWTTAATWSTAACNGAAAAVAPGAADNVTICAGHTVTMDGNAGAANSLTITGTATWSQKRTTNVGAGGVIVTGDIAGASAGVLTTSGGLTINATTTSTAVTVTLQTTAGQTISGTGSLANLAISATATNTGTLTVTTALTGASTLTNTGTLNIGGTSTITGLTANTAANTVNYTGTAQTVKQPTANTYSTLGLSGSLGKTMTGITSITGNLNLSGSATMTGNAAFTLNGTLNYGSTGSTTLTAATAISIGKFSQTAGTFVDNGNTITVTGTGASTWSKAGTFTATGTAIFTGAAPQIGASNFGTLTINVGGGNTATLTGNATPSGGLNVSSGTFDLSSSTANRSAAGGTLTVSNGATLKIGGSNSFPTQYTTHTLGATSTVEYYGTSQTVTAESYGHLTLSGTGTVTMPASALTLAGNFTMSTAGSLATTAGGALTVTGNFNIGSGTTFNTSTFTHPITGNFVVNGTLSGTGPITLNGSGTQIDGTGSITDTGTVTISSGNKTVQSTANLSFPGTVAISGAVTVTNNGTITSTAATGITGTVAGSTWTNAANSALTVAGPLLATGTLSASASPNTVTYNGTVAQSVKSATYHHLALSNAAGTSLGGATTVNGNLTISSGTLSDSGNQITGNATGTLSMAAGTGLSLGSAGSGTAFPTTFTTANISLTAGSTVTYAAGVAQTVSGVPGYANLTINNAAGTSLGGATTVNGNLTISSGTLSDSGNQITGNASGTLSISSGAGLTLGSAGTGTVFPTNFTAANISLNTASTVTYAAGVAQTVSAVPTYGNLTINNSAAVVTSLGGSTTVAGTPTLSGSGTFAVGANTLTLNGPTIAGTPTKLTTTSSSSLSFGGSSAGVSVPSSVANLNNLTLGNSCCAITLNSAITLAGTLQISAGGALDVTTSNFALNVAGNFTNNNAAASFTARSGTVTMNGSAAQTIGGSASTTFNNLTVSNSNSGTTVAVNTNVNVSGTLTVNTSAPLAPAAAVVINSAAAQGTITGTGTVQISRTAVTADYSSQYKFTTNTLTNLTVEYKGAAAQTVSALTYGGLKINNASGATLASGTTTVGGTLTLTSGTLAVAGNSLALNGPTIAGTPTNLSTTSSSNLSFGGSSSSVNVPSSVTQLNNLTLNNSNGITLNSSPTINATMTFTSGVISAGSNTLIIATAGTVSRTSGHVNGNLQKNVATGANVVRNFEVGDSSIYSPVQVTFTSVSAAGNLTATAVSGEHPDIARSTIDSTKDVGRYWVVTNSGITFTNYSASWTYVAGDVDAAADVTIFGIGKADSCDGSTQNCTWTYPTIVGTPSTTNAQGSGMTGFSSFAVGRNVRSFSVSNPGTQSQYVPFIVTITALDQSGNPATNFSATVDITSSGCTISSGGGTSANFTNGSLSPTVTLSSSGNCTITATLTGGGPTGTSPTFTVNPTSFNAFETATAATAITGNIQTKVAGNAFSLAIVAISGGAKATGFNGNVKLELLANGAAAGTGYGIDNCPTTNTVIQTVASSAIAGGRSNASFSAVANVYRDVRVRISYPTASSSTVVCSGDSFAIRPSGFTISVTDADWQTAGTARALSNTAASGGNVHKAGQSFTITATVSPNTVTLYDGNITVATSGLACTNFGSGCTNGTLSLGTWSTGVTRSTSTATYAEAGSFNLALEDVDFASIDASDGSSFTVTQTAAPVAVGRFVPDHFKFVTPNTPQLRTFGSMCSTRSFTYIGQSFWYVTSPSATLQAVAADNTTITTNYRGSLFKLTALAGNGITETYSYSGAVALDSTGIGTAQLTELSGANSGKGTYQVSSSGTLTYTRNTTTPAGQFSADISLSVTAKDTSEAGANQGDITTPSALSFSSIAFDAGATFRYGRLRLQNSSGLLNVDLWIPIETQYWTGSAFTTNTDDYCTQLTNTNLSLGSYIGGITAANVGASHITLGGGAFAKGVGSLRLTKPSPVATSPGATTLTVDLSAEGKTYLQGAWSGTTYIDNPSARATFGVFGSQPKNFIFQRENY